MNRIDAQFKKLKKEGRKALIPFITAGDPTLDVTEKLVYALEEAGANIIELGVPFSDPMADGPVIQHASERALKGKVTLESVIKLVAKIRKKTQIPILLMGYYNPIFVYGEARFAENAKKAGVDAVLIVDLPPEESGSLNKILKAQGLHQIFLLAPTSSPDRVAKVARHARGFVYYVSLTGVTGAKLDVNADLAGQVKFIREQCRKPVAVGFGISTPKDVARIAPIADGVVVGSALVKVIEKTGKGAVPPAKKFISSLRKSIR